MPTDPIPDDQVWRDLADRNHGMAIYPPRDRLKPLPEVPESWYASDSVPLPVRRLSWWRRLRLRWGRSTPKGPRT